LSNPFIILAASTLLADRTPRWLQDLPALRTTWRLSWPGTMQAPHPCFFGMELAIPAAKRGMDHSRPPA
jgi:hypothetical protein